ncbi:putative transposase [Shigella flexneri K-1770]|nr:putative transposase [Shigella flexneri K-1770]
MSVKLRLPQTDTPEPTRPVTNPFWRKNHGSLAAANRGVAEYELSE